MSQALSVQRNSNSVAARGAGLVYIGADAPGIRRKRHGNGFMFQSPNNRLIRDPGTLRRVSSLAIPPAWEDVWICPNPLGHIQATGRDARGRKQYIYHPRWRSVRDQLKFDRLLAFGESLKKLRRRLAQDLGRRGLPKAKVMAAVVSLLQSTLIRVGNEEYAQNNDSFGLTTLRNHHVQVRNRGVRFQFHGKSGIYHALELRDRRLARIIRCCQELPGQVLFQYVDGTKQRVVKSEDINEYLRHATGGAFTAKDFRTWAGTVLAAMELSEFQAFESVAQAKRHVVRAVEFVARRLGNTKTVCRQCYIHPAIIEAYLDGSLRDVLRFRAERELTYSLQGVSPAEAAVLAFLRKRLQRSSTRKAS